MRVGVGIFVVMLVVILPLTYAADTQELQTAAVDKAVADANRFLAAETTKQMKAGFEDVKTQINSNNDENMRILDTRMGNLIMDVKQKIIIGTLGAILVAQAIIGLALMYVWRRYSYEYYQSQLIKGQKEEIEAMKSERDQRSMAEMQQPQWYPQEVQKTYSTEHGQAAAANMSAMNAWQMQAPHQGYWVSPQPVQPIPPYDPSKYQQTQEQYEGGQYGPQ
jgi:hypothetical protein